MSGIKRFALGTIGLLLVIAAFGFLTESGLLINRMRPGIPFSPINTAIGAPLFALGVWVAYKAGYKPFRPFKRESPRLFFHPLLLPVTSL